MHRAISSGDFKLIYSEWEEKGTRAFQLYCITRQLMFTGRKFNSCISRHKHTPSLEETEVSQEHPGQPYLLQKTLFAQVIQYAARGNDFAMATALREVHISPIYKPCRKGFSPDARCVLPVQGWVSEPHTMLLLSEGKLRSQRRVSSAGLKE